MYAVVSDIHGNLPAIEAVVADAEGRGCRIFVNLGDALSGPLWPAETADYLIARDWPTITGNHERQLLTLGLAVMNQSDRFTIARLSSYHLRWLANLPSSRIIEDGVLLCHGSPASDIVYLLHDLSMDGVLSDASGEAVNERLGGHNQNLIFCGHTHLPRLLSLPGGRRVCNPGSVGLPAYDDDHPVYHRVESGTTNASYAVVNGEQISLVSVPYDNERAAAKAQSEGRGDWAHALRTGHVLPL